MPRQVKDPALSERAVFSTSRKLRDVKLAEVRAHLEHEAGRAVAWHEVIEYLYAYWKESRGDQP